MINNIALYIAWIFVFIGFLAQRKAYKLKCKECELLYSILKIRDAMEKNLESFIKNTKFEKDS